MDSVEVAEATQYLESLLGKTLRIHIPDGQSISFLCRLHAYANKEDFLSARSVALTGYDYALLC